MNEPPAALLRLTRLLRGEPTRTFSRGRYWSLVGVGLAEFALFAGFLAAEPSGGDALTGSIMIFVGLLVASQGAAGLLKEDRRELSLWFLVLHTLFGFPLLFLTGAQLYAWMGHLGAVAWVAIVVLIFVWDRARRR